MNPRQTDDDRHPRAPNHDGARRRAEEHHQAQAQALLSLRRSLFGETPYVSIRREKNGGSNAANANADSEEEGEANAKRTGGAYYAGAKKKSAATFSSAAGLAFVSSEQQEPPPPQQKIRRSKTPPIPLPEYHIARTSSELELNEEMMAAERRERVMYNRLVSGMRQNAQKRQERMMWRGGHNQLPLPLPQNQHDVRHDEQQPTRPPLRQGLAKGLAVSPRKKHAEVLGEALRIAESSKRELLEATETGVAAAAAAAGAQPAQPQLELKPAHRFLLEPQDCGVSRGGEDAEVERRLLQKKKLVEVLDRVANEEWSIEGFDGFDCMGGGGSFGYGSPRFGMLLPQFPLLPPAGVGGCGMNGRASLVVEPSSSVPGCFGHHDDDDMVFSMDL